MDMWIGIGWKGKKWGEGREKEGLPGLRWLQKCLFVDNEESEDPKKFSLPIYNNFGSRSGAGSASA